MAAVTFKEPEWRMRSPPIKLLVLGYGGPGSEALQQAVETLNIGACHHMSRTKTNPSESRIWQQAFRAKFEDEAPAFTNADWDQLFAGYTAVCDFPAVAFAPELMDAYPDAKIILSTSDAESWYAASRQTLQIARRYWLHSVLQYLDPDTASEHGLRRKMWQCLWSNDLERNGKAAMLAHNATIRKKARETGREVLEYRMQDGWAPLCKFLGVKVPDGRAFPQAVSAEEYQKQMREEALTRCGGVVWRAVQVCLFALGIMLGLWALLYRAEATKQSMRKGRQYGTMACDQR